MFNVDLAEKVIKQLDDFGQGDAAGHAITVLDALHNIGYVVHEKDAVECEDAWHQG